MKTEFWVDWLKGKIKEYNDYLMSLDKESISLNELNQASNSFLKRFYLERSVLRTAIRGTPYLKEEWYELCKDDFILWSLLDLNTKDINRNPTTPVQPVIPYYHQMDLIKGIIDETKNLHVEKSRRQGASLWTGDGYPSHELLFGFQRLNFTTHKDKGSLWEKYDDANSTFGKIMFTLKHSIFFEPSKLLIEPTFQDVRIAYKNNILSGEVLSPSTAVGFQANNALIDEIDPVCEEYPNQAWKLTSGFSASSNRILLYSTYRSMEYPFYKFTETHDDSMFNFVVLDWKDHPLCNSEWYKKECAKLAYNPVLIARELDHNPRMAISGRIYNFYTEENDLAFAPINDGNKWGKIIFADFGGGTSATAFICAYYRITGSQMLYLHKALKTTTMDATQIKNWFKANDFEEVPVVGDISALNQATYKGSDWAGALSKVGIKFTPVNNKNMGGIRQQVNLMFRDKLIYVNKNSIELRDLYSYRYKGDDVDKGPASHLGDALGYGARFLYIRDNGYLGFV